MKPKKSLGQHFLTSTKIVDDIVAASGVTKGNIVLEIGPGRGILTKSLLRAGAHVLAVEKDDGLIPELETMFASEITSKQMEIIHADILEAELPQIQKIKYKIVANIPYYITGQIIRKFLESEKQPDSMTILVQKEVAERVIARDKKESLLSLSVKAFGTPKLVRVVSAGSFNPPPNVDSAVLHIADISKEKLQGVGEKDFFEILHLGFAHKRKQLVPNLSEKYPKEKVLEALTVCNLLPTVRAEDIGIEVWIRLASHLLFSPSF